MMTEFRRTKDEAREKLSTSDFIEIVAREADEKIARRKVEEAESDISVETFEAGEPVDDAQGETPAKVEIPDTVVGAESDTVVPTEVAEVDKKIGAAVEDELQAEGVANPAVQEEVSAVADVPTGSATAAEAHDRFTKTSGEAATSDAETLEMVASQEDQGWKPPETEEEQDGQDMADMAALLRIKEQKAINKGDTAGAEKAARQAEAAERASGGRALGPETSRDIKNLRAMMEIKAAKGSAGNNNELGERGVLLHDLTAKVRELGGEPEYIIPEEILSYGSELGKIKYDDMTDQQKADSELTRAAASNILRDWIKEHENATTTQGSEHKVEQIAPIGEIKIVEKEMIGKGSTEIPTGEEWHVDVVGKSTVTINNGAKLLVTGVAGKNHFIIIGNGQLEIAGMDSGNTIEKR